MNMKNHFLRLTCTLLLGSATSVFCQSPFLHRFQSITSQAGGAILVTLTNSVSYFDLYPIEVSSNLTGWEPLATLLRTNNSTAPVSFLDAAAATQPKGFYRTPTNQLITPIPAPSGPYAVGTLTRLFTDPSRTNRYNIGTNSSFMVQFWYPAIRPTGVPPAAYIDPRIARNWAVTFSDPNPAALLAMFQSAVSHAIAQAPWATNQTQFPVVLFSHGYQCIRSYDTDVMEDLASYGFVTVAIDHFDAWVSVFADGRIVQGNAPPLPITLAQNVFNLQSRASDIRFVLDELARLNQEDVFFKGRLDLDHIGMFGHSLGGAVTADACAGDSRLKAGLTLDGGGHTNLLGLHVTQPFLIASGDDANSIMQPYRKDFRSFFDQLTHDAYWLQITNSVHFDFVEWPWVGSARPPAEIRTAMILRRYAASFFNKYLRGQDDHFLDGPPAEFPEVDIFLQK